MKNKWWTHQTCTRSLRSRFQSSHEKQLVDATNMLSHCAVTFLEIECETVCCYFVKHILRHTLLTHNTQVVDAINVFLIKVTL